MKTSKPSPQSPSQGQCGVWLDPVELKAKVKKKQRFQPISKLLNPFARGDGYSLAVALNFTQTKIKMPNAKQSSISSFFTPQRRVLNKMSTSGDPHVNQASTSVAHRDASSPTPVALGRKRKRDDVDGLPSVKAAGIDLGHRATGYGWTGQSLVARTDTGHHEHQDTAGPQWDRRCREQGAEALPGEPRGTERLPESSTAPVETAGSDRHAAELSEKPLSDCCSSQNIQERMNGVEKMPDSITHDARRHSDLSHQGGPAPTECSHTGMHFIESLVQSESDFGAGLGSAERTSTQKAPRPTREPPLNEEHGQRRLKCSRPRHEHVACDVATAPRHLDERTGPETKSPLRCESDRIRPKAEKPMFVPEGASATPNHPPCDNRVHHRVQGDGAALLFTQDSEGFRVIAHRGPRAPRAPLRDHSNLGLARARGPPARKHFVFEAQEKEMLFTQDSQGNMVIKH